MKTENHASQLQENIPTFIDPSENNRLLSDDKNPDLPVEAAVIANSATCSFMGARSPWANT